MTTGVDGSKKGVNFHFGKKDNAIYDNDGFGAEGLMMVVLPFNAGAFATAPVPDRSSY